MRVKEGALMQCQHTAATEKNGAHGWPWVGGGCGGRGPHARVRATAGSVVARLAVGCVRGWRRGGVAAASRVRPSRVLGGCVAADRG